MDHILSGSRRKLLVLMGSFLSALGIKQVAQAQKTSTPPDEDGFMTVTGPESILAERGQLLTDQVLIIKDEKDGNLVGVSPFCTHRQCAVDWNQEKRLFICPCHGAEFDQDGKVVTGPAETDLKAFQVRVKEDRFQIKPIPSSSQKP